MRGTAVWVHAGAEIDGLNQPCTLGALPVAIALACADQVRHDAVVSCYRQVIIITDGEPTGEAPGTVANVIKSAKVGLLEHTLHIVPSIALTPCAPIMFPLARTGPHRHPAP